MAGRIANTSTNGIISVALITRIIDEYNNIYDWLNQIGYDSDKNGMSVFQYWSSRRRAYINVVKGADDFKVFSARVPFKLKNGKKDHGTYTLNLPPTSKANERLWGAMTVSVDSEKLPAFASIKSRTGTQVVIDVRTLENATAADPVNINLIAIAIDADDDIGIA